MTDFETCFDRDYECCDLTSPPDGLRYDEWYDAHVEAWRAHQSAVRASKQSVPDGADSALPSDEQERPT